MSHSSIFIVGCDAYLAGIYARKFERDHWHVDVMETIDSATRRAAQQRPNILFLDDSCLLDAAEEIRTLRTLPTLQNTHLVLVSRTANKTQIDAVLRAGASDYLLYGHFVPQEAVDKMRNLLAQAP